MDLNLKLLPKILIVTISLIVCSYLIPIALSNWFNESNWLDSSGTYIFSTGDIARLETIFGLFFIIAIGLSFYYLWKKNQN